jgi:hypothetical protein
MITFYTPQLADFWAHASDPASQMNQRSFFIKNDRQWFLK